MVRNVIFWAHLIAGLAISLVLALMMATGVLLTYERQLVRWSESSSLPAEALTKKALPADEIIANVRRHWPTAVDFQVILPQNTGEPVRVSAGRQLLGFMDPTSGARLEDTGKGTRAFFSELRTLHRWIGQSGDNRATAKSITGIVTIIFAVMIISGVYLWLPKLWTRTALKPRIWFRSPTKTAQARHFTWHHSFSFWTWPLLLALSLSGLLFSYKGFQNQVSDFAGSLFTAAEARTLADFNLTEPLEKSVKGPFEAMASTARDIVPDAKRLHFTVSSEAASSLNVRADAGSGGEPTKRVDIDFDPVTRKVIAIKPFDTTPAGRQTIIWFRYLHTGELFGILGQTVAGLACLAALFLIYSGVMLGTKRVVRLVKSNRANPAGSR